MVGPHAVSLTLSWRGTEVRLKPDAADISTASRSRNRAVESRRSAARSNLETIDRLRGNLHRILDAAVAAVDPGPLVTAALAPGASFQRFSSQPLFVVAAGKAAWRMASAFERACSSGGFGAPTAPIGLIAGPRPQDASVPGRFEWFDAAHPWPDSVSEAAGRRALALAEESRARGTLVVLLSGGASAMLAVPAEGLTIAVKAAATRVLVDAGAPIDEVNCVRKHLSAIKGGRLAAAAARTITLAISDVHGPVADDPAVIGSGPTVADPSTFADAREIVRGARIMTDIPQVVIDHLQRAADETPKPGDRRLAESTCEVIANRHTAMEGAAGEARALGYDVRILTAATSGEARDAGAAFAAAALSQAAGGSRLCVVASGETTVRIRGTGRGGRNQEFALATVDMLQRFRDEDGRVAALASAGTDGIDGPTSAAGAVVDSTSAARARHAGVAAAEALSANNSYDYFRALGDLLEWGPTGTNVGDIHLLLIDGSRR